MRFQATCWCFLVLARVVGVHAAASPVIPGGGDRAVVGSVRLLEPAGDGLVASDPVDVLIEDGRVARVGSDLIKHLEPGQVALRGRELWLLPAPRVRLPGAGLAPHDLVVAGLLGMGTVGVVSDGATHQHLLARARLDGLGLPLLEEVSSTAEASTQFELTGSSPADMCLPAEPAKVERLLDALARRSEDPFLPGAPARFLVLDSDPREDPESLSDPFAVVQGSTLILKSERIVLLDEYAAFLALEAPTTQSLGWPDGASSGRRYTLLIRGLPRGFVQVASWNEPDGSIRVRVAERVAAPMEEAFDATIRWPSGEVACTWRVQSRSFTMNAGPVEEGVGQELDITLNGRPLHDDPVVLAPGDRFLPHSMMIAYDALFDPTQGSTTGLVEVDVMGAPVRIERSQRVPFHPVSGSEHRLPLPSAQIHALGRHEGGQLRSRSAALAPPQLPSEHPLPGDVLLLDGGVWPRLMIHTTPWGVVEWASSSPEP